MYKVFTHLQTTNGTRRAIVIALTVLINMQFHFLIWHVKRSPPRQRIRYWTRACLPSILVHILCYGNTRRSSILLRGGCRGHRWLAAPPVGFSDCAPHIPARAGRSSANLMATVSGNRNARFLFLSADSASSGCRTWRPL